MQALGCHVFAGGFSNGVMKEIPVVGQLELHGLGYETVKKQLGIEIFHAERWEDWPKMKPDVLFGNPRCTGFSNLTGGYGDAIHGPFAKCTQDIRDLCEYGVEQDIPIICWESVQQAYTTGKPLVDWLIENKFRPNDYRICHLFLSAATFGNAQNRRRYFFVAYKKNLKFNCDLPTLPTQATVGQKINSLMGLRTAPASAIAFRDGFYDGESHYNHASDLPMYPLLRQGESLSNVCERDLALVKRTSTKHYNVWIHRESDLPFSLHAAVRLDPDKRCPTLASSCHVYVHPELDRSITVREAATLMGWNYVPIGGMPFYQIAKGICPEVGTWLAQQFKYSLNGTWGEDDWESTYTRGGHFEGRETTAEEKIFNFTRFVDDNNKQILI